ncbi:MAG TPA: hypothetical protein VHX66_10420 [Solirubrobacteraceae bacterium]|jgi:hypothetical protein|nr:hypothetical protein [Solirubrobacteraceae bacterium]
MSDPFEILHDELVRVAPRSRAISATHTHGAGALRSRFRTNRWLRRPLVLAIVLVGGSASLGGLAIAGTLTGRALSPGFAPGTIGPQAWVDGQRVTPEAATTPDQRMLAILRRPILASWDALPAYYVHTMTDSPAAANGINVSLARRADGFTSGAAWVVPANGGVICLVADNAQALQMDMESGNNGTAPPPSRVPGAEGDFNCESGSTVATGWQLSYGVEGTTPDAPSFTAGIVPDGVSQTTVGVLNGPTTTFPVHDNVWMGDVPGVPDSETFTGPNGPVTRNWAATLPPPTTSTASTGSTVSSSPSGS